MVSDEVKQEKNLKKVSYRNVVLFQFPKQVTPPPPLLLLPAKMEELSAACVLCRSKIRHDNDGGENG